MWRYVVNGALYTDCLETVVAKVSKSLSSWAFKNVDSFHCLEVPFCRAYTDWAKTRVRMQYCLRWFTRIFVLIFLRLQHIVRHVKTSCQCTCVHQKTPFCVKIIVFIRFQTPVIISPPVGMWSIAMNVYVCTPGMSVCLFVCSRISKTHSPNFTKFSLPITCGRRSVVHWQQCNTLRTSGFVENFFFHIMKRISQNQRWRVCFVQFLRWRNRERNLPSPTVSMVKRWCHPHLYIFTAADRPMRHGASPHAQCPPCYIQI